MAAHPAPHDAFPIVFDPTKVGLDRLYLTKLESTAAVKLSAHAKLHPPQRSRLAAAQAAGGAVPPNALDTRWSIQDPDTKQEFVGGIREAASRDSGTDPHSAHQVLLVFDPATKSYHVARPVSFVLKPNVARKSRFDPLESFAVSSKRRLDQARKSKGRRDEDGEEEDDESRNAEDMLSRLRAGLFAPSRTAARGTTSSSSSSSGSSGAGGRGGRGGRTGGLGASVGGGKRKKRADVEDLDWRVEADDDDGTTGDWDDRLDSGAEEEAVVVEEEGDWDEREREQQMETKTRVTEQGDLEEVDEQDEWEEEAEKQAAKEDEAEEADEEEEEAEEPREGAGGPSASAPGRVSVSASSLTTTSASGSVAAAVTVSGTTLILQAGAGAGPAASTAEMQPASKRRPPSSSSAAAAPSSSSSSAAPSSAFTVASLRSLFAELAAARGLASAADVSVPSSELLAHFFPGGTERLTDADKRAHMAVLQQACVRASDGTFQLRK